MTGDENQKVWDALREVHGSDLITATLVVLIKEGDTVKFKTIPFLQEEEMTKETQPSLPEQEAASIIQAVTDPENQPNQFGTVTLDYHFEKIKEWEDRFEKLSDRALAQPAQERPWAGLTDEEIDVIDEANWDEDDKSWGIHDFARAIEQRLKEKNK
jgi:hypothetical protein